MASIAEKMVNGQTAGHMAEAVGNAFIYDADLHELLCGVELDFRGNEMITEFYSTTLESNLGKPYDFTKFHR